MKTSNVPATEEELNRQLKRLLISKDDFDRAEMFLVEFNQNQSDVIKSSLLNSAVIAYARPFSPNELSKNADATSKVPEQEITEILTDDQKKLHKRILNLRNKAIAHSESSLNPLEIDYMSENELRFLTRPFEILGEISPYYPFKTSSETLSLEEFKELIKLVRTESENYASGVRRQIVSKLNDESHV